MGAKIKDLGTPKGIDQKEYAQLWAHLLRKCTRLMRSKTRGEELAEKVMVKLVEFAMKHPQDERPLLPVLLNAADKAAIDEYRADQRLARLYAAIDAPALAALPDPDQFIKTENERRVLAALTADELKLLELFAHQQGHLRPKLSRREAARQYGLETENQFEYQVRKLKEKINRVVAENGIDLDIPPAELTRPSASKEN